MPALNPTALHPPFGAYSHGVIRDGLLVSSGQLALGPDGTIPQGARAQAEMIFAHLDAILRAGGLTRADVLRLTAFVTDRAHMAPYMAARDAWVAALDPLPASTLLIVSGFTRPEFLVEIEMLAWRAPS